MNFRTESAPVEARIELTPLIDVVFQLLIFFLLTTSFIAERAVDVELPAADAQASPQEKKTILAVTVTRDGEIAHDERMVSIPELTDVFRRAAAKDREQIVVIRGDHAVSHGRVVQVMDLARVHGLTKLAIATAPRDEGGEGGEGTGGSGQ